MHMTYFQSTRLRKITSSKLKVTLIIATVWLVAAGTAWFYIIYQSPENVFKGMLNNNFSTNGYTKDTTTEQNGVQSRELAQLQLASGPTVQTLTSLSQGSDFVTTTTINKADATYVRYDNIKTSRKNPNGKQYDFKHVIGVWAKSEAATAGSNQAVAQMMLGLLPVAKLTPSDRSYMLDQVERNNIFTPDYKTVKKQTKDGRLQYVYDVKVVPAPYIDMLKQFGKLAGLGDQVADLNPSDYKGQPATTISVTVDAKSRHLVSVGSPGQTTQSETYTSFGIVKPVTLPTKNITTDELQKRLNVQ